jgi:hypothetical protein
VQSSGLWATACGSHPARSQPPRVAVSGSPMRMATRSNVGTWMIGAQAAAVVADGGDIADDGVLDPPGRPHAPVTDRS